MVGFCAMCTFWQGCPPFSARHYQYMSKQESYIPFGSNAIAGGRKIEKGEQKGFQRSCVTGLYANWGLSS